MALKHNRTTGAGPEGARLSRKGNKVGDKAMVADRLRDYYDGEAKERMKAGGGDKKSKSAKQNGGGKIATPDNSTKSRDAAGAAVGVSGKLVDAARIECNLMDNHNQLDQLQAEIDQAKRRLLASNFQSSAMLDRMADFPTLGAVEQLREEINRDRDEHLKAGRDACLEPYRRSLLARHFRLDDWPDDAQELAHKSIEAAELELCELAQEHFIPPRLLLLLDSYERIIRHFAGLGPDSVTE